MPEETLARIVQHDDGRNPYAPISNSKLVVSQSIRDLPIVFRFSWRVDDEVLRLTEIKPLTNALRHDRLHAYQARILSKVRDECSLSMPRQVFCKAATERKPQLFNRSASKREICGKICHSKNGLRVS